MEPTPAFPKDEDPGIMKLFPFSSVAVVVMLILLKPDELKEFLRSTVIPFQAPDYVVYIAFVVLLCAAMGLARLGMIGYEKVVGAYKEGQKKKEELKKERVALVAIFDSTNGKSWKDKTRWGSNEPVSKWKGVFVDRETQSVTKLILPDNEMTGTLPGAAFLHLPNLNEIDFRQNEITGEIPQELSKLTKLEGLYLYENNFEGRIPLALADLPRLSGIYLFNNRLNDIDEAKEVFRAKVHKDCHIFI